MTWWHDELSLDERRDVKKAWLVCLESNQVVVGPDINPLNNAHVVMDYLKDTDDYWAERLALKRPQGCLKWRQFYTKVYHLTREQIVGSGKKTPGKLPTEPESETGTRSPQKSQSPPVFSPASQQIQGSSLVDDEDDEKKKP